MRKPEEITSYEFKKGRGYKAEEVDDYLRSVSADYRRLYLENQSVQEKLLLVTRELQNYKNKEENPPAVQQAEAAVPAAEPTTDPSYTEALKEENHKLRSQLKEAEKLLAQKFETFRNQYISFLETQLTAIKSENFSFSIDTQTRQILEKEVEVPAEKEAPRSHHKKSDDLFQMLDHMNQQMKEESDARMLQKIADEVASVQKETAGTKAESKEEDVFDPKPGKKEEHLSREKQTTHTEGAGSSGRKKETEERKKRETSMKNDARKIPVVKNSSIRSGTGEKKIVSKESKHFETPKEKTLVEQLAEKVEASESEGQTIVFRPVKEEAFDMDKTIVFQPVHSEKGESGQ